MSTPSFCIRILLFIFIVLIPLSSAKWNYTFTVSLSNSFFEILGDGSQDSMWWRLCSDTECGIFIHSIWSTAGATYTHTYTTPTYFGPITRIDIAHTSDDMLGLEWVQADGIRYEPGGLTGVWSVEYTGGSPTGCDTTTITADGSWYHGEFDDCIFQHHFHQTYSPTPSPTAPTNAPTYSPVSESESGYGSDSGSNSGSNSESEMNSQSSYYELVVKDHAINELNTILEPEITDYILGVVIPGFNATIEVIPGFETNVRISDSEIESISWSDLTIGFDPTDQAILISMQNVSGSLSSMDIEADFLLTYCYGSARPQYEGWNMQFAARLSVDNEDNVDNEDANDPESCALELIFDEDSVVIDHDDLYINVSWDDPLCGGLYWIFDVLLNVETYFVDEFIGFLPPMIVKLLDQEMHSLLPQSQTVELDALGIEETMKVCYRNITIIPDAVMIGMDFQFEDDAFSDFTGFEMDLVAFTIPIELGQSDLTELIVIFGFGFVAFLSGCGCRYWKWKRGEKQYGKRRRWRGLCGMVLRYRKVEASAHQPCDSGSSFR